MKLLRHQIQTLDFLQGRPYALVKSGMSTQKTTTTLTYLSGFPGLKLVVCPKPVIDVFVYQNIKHELGLNVIPLKKGNSNSKNDLLQSLQGSNNIVVVNYETAKLLDLKSVNFSAVVCDEGHRLGSYNSKQSINLAKMCVDIPHKAVMTGTPFTDKYDTLYGIFRWFDPIVYTGRRYPTSTHFGSWSDFQEKYWIYFVHNNIRIRTGYKNIDQLTNIIKPHMIEFKSEDVVDLPDIISNEYYVNLQKKAAKYYKELERDNVIEDIEFAVTHQLPKLQKLHMLSSSGLLDDIQVEGINERKEALQELVEEIYEPVVIFTRFINDVKLIKALVNEEVSEVTGEKNTLQDWYENKTRILIVNIGAGSEGIDLSRARHAIFWSVGYSAQQYQQALFRIRRSNSAFNTVFLHHIITRGTIEEDIYRIVFKKLEYEKKLEAKLNESS